MKRSTWITLGVFALLLALWFVKDCKVAPTGPAPLSLDGYVGNVSEQEFRTAIKDQPSPVKSLVLKKKDETIRLTQLVTELPKDVTPDTTKPVEAKWQVSRERGGKSTEAKAQPYRAGAMAEVFGRSIRSTFAKEAKQAELAEYGLDANHALEVEAATDKATFKLKIGTSEKPQDGSEPTTWVQDPAHPEVIYQVSGRDLRSPFDVPWSDLRDRGLLTVDLAALDRIDVENPRDFRAQKFSVSRGPLGDKKTREAGEGWKIESPVGFEVGDVGEWAKSLERLSASEFLDASEVAANKAQTGLDDPKTAARVTLTEGSKKTVLVFGTPDEGSAQKDVWLRIEGRDEVYKIASYSRDQALQRFDQIRDRALLGPLKVKDASALTLVTAEGTLRATRQGELWSVSGSTAPMSSTLIDTWLSDLEGVKVDFAEDVTPGTAELTQPEWQLSLQMSAGPVAIALSAEKDGSVYGQVSAAGQVGDIFKLASWNAGRLKKKFGDFEDKHLIGLKKDEIEKIEVTAMDGSFYAVLRQSGEWKIKKNNDLLSAKSEAVSEWITVLLGMERAGESGLKKEAEVGLDKGFASVILTDKAGEAWTVRLSSQKSGDDSWASAGQAGRPLRVVTVNASAAAQLQKPADGLLGP